MRTTLSYLYLKVILPNNIDGIAPQAAWCVNVNIFAGVTCMLS